MRLSFRAKVLIGFAHLFVVLGIFTWKLQQIAQESDRDSQWVTRTHEVLRALEQVHASMVDIETGERGYVITANPDYLEPYHLGSEGAAQILSTLRALTADSPSQQRHLDTLQTLVQLKVLRSNGILRIRDTAGADAAMQQIRQGVGKRHMDRIRAELDAMEEEENNRLSRLREEAAQSGRYEQYMVYAAILIAFGFAVALLWLVLRYPAALEKSKSELEQQVRDRTASLEALNRLYGTLSQVNQAIVRTKVRTELFETICSVAVEFGSFKLAWIGLFDQVSGDVERVATASKKPVTLPFRTFNVFRSPFQEGLIGTAVITGRVEYGNDIRTDPGARIRNAGLIGDGFRSAAVVPFRLKGKVHGVLNLFAAEPDFFALEQERSLLEEMSLDISFALDAMEVEAERTQAETALRESEAKYRSTLDNMLEGCQIIGYDWRYLYLNDAGARHGRRPKQELIGNTMMDMYPGIESTDVFRKMRSCMEDRIPQYMENEFTFPDGVKEWFDLRIEPVREGIFVLSVEITERKRAEAMQRQNEKQLRQIIDLVPHFIFAKDSRGTFIIVNKAMAEALGTSPEELTGKKDSDIAQSKEELHRYRAGEAEVLESDRPTYLPEEEFTDARGRVHVLSTVKTPFVVRSSGLRGVLGVSVDITERKQAEESLRKSEEQFRLISENVADMIAVLDLEGKRIYNSPSYVPILGDPVSLKGTDSFQDIHPDDREKIRNIFHESVKTGVGQAAEYRLVAKDGSIRHIESRGSIIRDNAGRIARVVVVSRDVTERKVLEKQFLRAQRMESIGTLAGGIAHDLNNVLAPVMLSLDVIGKKLPDEESQRLVQMLQSTARRGSELIKQVLSFARGVEGDRTIVQLRHLIEEIGKIMHQTFPKSISLRVDVPRHLPTLSADATQLHQVLMNLCVNARDAMPNGGLIEIKAESVRLDEQYARMHVGSKPGFYVVISVTDQGMGIPPGHMERIFEPFFTTKEIGKGTGLGLSTVLGIIKSHDGFVNVYSEVGKGTTFKVYLPAHEIEQASLAERKESIPAGNGELILVVDDEAGIREITKTTLEAYGYAVVTAADGTEAVTAFARHDHNIAVVITDMMMPYMDGAATIRAIQKMNPKVKFLAVSGLKPETDILHQGRVMFLQKPFTAGQLLKSITGLLHQMT